MKALDQLASLLEPETPTAAAPESQRNELDRVIGDLQKRVDAGSSPQVPEEQQLAAVRHFWQTGRIETLATARLLCFGLSLPLRAGEPALIEDAKRFDNLLAIVDQWLDEPRRYRRCFQGLIRSYFSYDAQTESARESGRAHWLKLREYLNARLLRIVDKEINPDWVKAAVVNRHLFGDAPCAPHAVALLRGESASLDQLCERLGIAKSSWFLRDLVLAQVAAAAAFDDEKFLASMPDLLAVLAANPALRERGLVRLLQRHAASTQPARHAALLDAVLPVFGNPWLPGSDTRWGAAGTLARAMVAEWLRSDLIAGYFDRFLKDSRRAAFWCRYAKAITQVQVAIGDAASPPPEDLAWLQSLGVELNSASGATHALLLTIGDLRLVEFSDAARPLVGYDARKALPFDQNRMLSTVENGANSLHANPRTLLMQHQDGLSGWADWEGMFESTLRRSFGIEPGVATVVRLGQDIDLADLDLGDYDPSAHVPATQIGPSPMLQASGQDAHWRTAEAESVPFSRADLSIFARVHGLQIVDETGQGEGLWVLSDETEGGVARVLSHWGFTPVKGRGWRR